MAKRGFTVVFPSVDAEPGLDGLAAIFCNASPSSGIRVAITDVRAFPMSGMNSDQINILGNQGIIGLERITAASGGTTINPVKHDTDAGLISQDVTVRSSPESVTISGGTIRRFGDAFSFGITQTISLQAQYRAPNICDVQESSGRSLESHNVWHVDGVSATEPIVLQAGQGIAAIKRAYGVPQAHHWNLVLKVVSTGKTYRYTLWDAGSPPCLGDPIWSIMNESGSSIVIQVMIISMPDMGESNIPRYRLARVNGYSDGGSVTTVSAHDTMSDVTVVNAVTGPFIPVQGPGGLVENYRNYQGSPVPVASQQQMGVIRSWLGTIGLITESAAVNMHGSVLGRDAAMFEVWPGERRMPNWDGDHIFLSPGQGLAVIAGGNGLIETSEAAYITVEMTGYVETLNMAQPSTTYAIGF